MTFSLMKDYISQRSQRNLRWATNPKTWIFNLLKGLVQDQASLLQIPLSIHEVQEMMAELLKSPTPCPVVSDSGECEPQSVEKDRWSFLDLPDSRSMCIVQAFY